MTTTENDEPPVAAEKILKRKKKQARREVKLMLDIVKTGSKGGVYATTSDFDP
jgi:hypothetical protein